MAEFDTSVNLKILDSLTITSELGPEDFEKVTDMIDAQLYGLFPQSEITK